MTAWNGCLHKSAAGTLTLFLQLRRLQSVQNAATWFITGTRRTEHITPVLQSLHWLLAQQRILFNLAVLVHKCLNRCAPGYLADDCRWNRHRRPSIRSPSSMKLLEVPSTRTMFGEQSFAINRPRVWSSLPASFLTQRCQLMSFLIILRLISSFNSCGVCDSEQMPI